MSVMVMVFLNVHDGRDQDFLGGFEERHAQSMRLGALSHDVWKLAEPTDAGANWVGTMTFRDMPHFEQFGAAQEADPEAQATIGRILGPIAEIVSVNVGALRGVTAGAIG